jgi:hypothetical protein
MCCALETKRKEKGRAFNLGLFHKQEGNKHNDKNRMQTTWI